MLLCSECDFIMNIKESKLLEYGWELRTYECPRCGYQTKLDVLPCAVDGEEEEVSEAVK